MIGTDLSDLALAAAKELGRRIHGEKKTDASNALAKALVESFAKAEHDDMPELPLESVGFICSVLERFAKLEKRPTYKQLGEGAKRAAEQLINPSLSDDDMRKLIRFCIDLHDAAWERQEIFDIPPAHPDAIILA